jgi:hypothetical protein
MVIMARPCWTLTLSPRKTKESRAANAANEAAIVPTTGALPTLRASLKATNPIFAIIPRIIIRVNKPRVSSPRESWANGTYKLNTAKLKTKLHKVVEYAPILLVTTVPKISPTAQPKKAISAKIMGDTNKF